MDFNSVITQYNNSVSKMDIEANLKKVEASTLSLSHNIMSNLHDEEAKHKGVSDTSLLLSEGANTLVQFQEFRKSCVEGLKNDPMNRMRAGLFGHTPSLSDEEEATIRLNFQSQMTLAADSQNSDGTTSIGQVSTEFDSTVYEYPAMIDQDDVLMKYLQSRYFDSQSAIFQTQSAMVGFLPSSIRGALGKTIEAPAYTLNQFTCGYFGARIGLDMDKLSIQRNINGIGGNQAAYAQARAFAQLAVQTTQLMNIIAYKTKIDNGFTYSFSPFAGQGIGHMAYGRPTENVYGFDAPLFLKDVATGELSINADSTQYQELMTWFVKQDNGVVLNTKSLLEGLCFSSETNNAFAQQLVNNNNTPAALSFGAGLRYDVDPQRMYDSVPWLRGFRFMEVSGVAKTGTNAFGAISEVEYYMPAGYGLPIFREYNGQAMNGMFAFMPNERVSWLSNMQGIPNNMSPMSDPRSVGLRVVTSLDDHGNDPMWSAEITMKLAYINFLSATDYMLDFTIPKPE